MRKAVVVVVENEEDEVLLLQRGSDHKFFPDQLCFPGGKVDYIQESVIVYIDGKPDYTSQVGRWEEDAEAAVRETFEEVGAELDEFEETGRWLADVKEGFLVNVFYAKVKKSEFLITKRFPNREHVNCKWYKKGEIPDNAKGITRKELIHHGYI